MEKKKYFKVLFQKHRYGFRRKNCNSYWRKYKIGGVISNTMRFIPNSNLDFLFSFNFLINFLPVRVSIHHTCYAGIQKKMLNLRHIFCYHFQEFFHGLRRTVFEVNQGPRRQFEVGGAWDFFSARYRWRFFENHCLQKVVREFLINPPILNCQRIWICSATFCFYCHYFLR